MIPDRPIVFAAQLPGQRRSRLYRCAPDGSGRRLLPTGEKSAFDPVWSPDGKEVVFLVGDAEGAPLWVVDAEGRTPPRAVPRTPAYAWLRRPAPTETRLTLPGGQVVRWEPAEDTGIIGFQCTDAHGTRTVKIQSTRGTPLFQEKGISGGILGFEPLPASLHAVLGWQLAGGNREGKWRVGIKIDLSTGVATDWGEYGYSGMMFAPDGRHFVTCFNRTNPDTEEEEHSLWVGETAHPQRRRRLVRGRARTVADWRGGLRTTPYTRG